MCRGSWLGRTGSRRMREEAWQEMQDPGRGRSARRCWYKEIRPGKERANKLESEWREGLWLRHSRRSNEAIIGTREGVVRAYAIKRYG